MMARKQEFVTERLLLQPLDPQDAEELLVIFSFDEVRSQMLVAPEHHNPGTVFANFQQAHNHILYNR
jgi:RimJ/RimL family protein N-acetyltransferase